MAGCAGLQVPVDTSHWELTKRGVMTVSNAVHPSGRHAATPQLTCSPALWERDTAFAFALPLSFPALPPACVEQKPVYAQLCWKDNKEGFVHPRQLKLTVRSKLWRNISMGCENPQLMSKKSLFLCAVRDSCNPFKYYEFPANRGLKGDSPCEEVSTPKAP